MDSHSSGRFVRSGRHGWRAFATFVLASAQGTTTTALAESGSLRASVASNPATTTTQILSDYGRLPLRFEENLGQVDSSVRYISRDANRTLFLTPTEAVIALHSDRAAPPHVVRMRFDGTDGAKRIVGEEPAESKTNYFVGKDPATWRAEVPAFSRVRYHDVYAGVDVVYYGNAQQLEYDFVLAPGAKASAIDLAFEGIDAVMIDRNGDLVLRTAAGDLRQKRPIAYQSVRGERRSVQARYVRRGPRSVGIAVGRYDRATPLTIDPLVLFYATYLGGSSADKALSLSVDAAGNAYVAGLTQSIDFPAANAAQPAIGGSTDIFISKINAAGTALIYSTYLGGSNIDAALGIAKDNAGNAYVTGYTASPNFPVTPGAMQTSLNGSAYDAFVAKLGPTGSLQYSTYLGGSDIDVANAVAVDGAGNAYVAGFTCSPDFPIVNAFQPSLHGAPYGCFSGWDAFVSKLNVGGTALVYSTYFGGDGDDRGSSLVVDPGTSIVYVAGRSASSSLPAGSVTPYQASNGRRERPMGKPLSSL